MNPDRLRPCVLAVIELATEIWVLVKRKEECVVTTIRRRASKLRRKRLHGEEDRNIKIPPRQAHLLDHGAASQERDQRATVNQCLCALGK